MTLEEFQDRVDPRRQVAINLLIAYIKDGLREMQLITDENVERIKTTLTAGKREYDIPADCIKIRNIKIIDSEDGVNSKYYEIPRIIGSVPDEDHSSV